jgi:DNA transformation protein
VRDHAFDLFADLGTITARAMMGGLTLYVDGRVFAIVAFGDRIHLKAKGAAAEALAAAGSERFAYPRRDGTVAHMDYWTLPDAALDDPAEACAWARRALAEPDAGRRRTARRK